MDMHRHFSDPGYFEHGIFSEPVETRTASVSGAKGKTVFYRENLEFPVGWTQQSVNVVARHYLMDYEYRFVDVVRRLTQWYRDSGIAQKYFDAGSADAKLFADEISWLLYNRVICFNSPAWYNLGVKGHKQQVAACFISEVGDSMTEINAHTVREIEIFRWGSGSGAYVGGIPKDLDHPERGLLGIRSRHEHVFGRGTASGPLSYMSGWDAQGKTMKSGGRTRRAAAIRYMGDRHAELYDPDMETDFIRCKVIEERLAQQLIEIGYSKDFSVQGGAYDRVNFQNANNNVLLTDRFMDAVKDDAGWDLYFSRPDRRPDGYEEGQPYKTFKARSTILHEIAKALWECGDPGVAFYDTIQAWNTVPHVAPILASNPCSEFLNPPNSSCNLCAIKLTALPMLRERFGIPSDLDAIKCVVPVTILAMDISIGASEYPDAAIEKQTKNLRALGLGFSDLGAYLMRLGVGYGSEVGNTIIESFCGTLTASAYLASASIAAKMRPFKAFEEKPLVDVLNRHRSLAKSNLVALWDKTIEAVKTYGCRNNQVTLMQPTGTTNFALGCDTTGIEPLVSYKTTKHLVGGGYETMLSTSFSAGLRHLGYTEAQIAEIETAVLEDRGIKEYINPEHHDVFLTALGDANKDLVLDPQNHLSVMSAIQRNISGSISKTVNLPSSTTPEQIEELIIDAHKRGIKTITFYRDNSKSSQPVSVDRSAADQPDKAKTEPVQEADMAYVINKANERVQLPSELPTIRKKIVVHGYDGVEYDVYLHVSEMDGLPVEIFIRLGKTGHMLSGMMDVVSIMWSMALQSGIPIDMFVNKFEHMSFAPQGRTDDADLGTAKSIIDVICRWLRKRYMTTSDYMTYIPDGFTADIHASVGGNGGNGNGNGNGKGNGKGNGNGDNHYPMFSFKNLDNACSSCGTMIPHDSCTCHNCGTSFACG